MTMRDALPAALLATVALAAGAGEGMAQSGPGTTGAAVLGFPGGARAAALGDAYAALGDDELAIFYNPAGLARAPRFAAGASYEAYALDVGLTAAAAAWSLGAGRAAIGLRYADYGQIAEIVPDPTFGGERGRATGQTLAASDLAFTVGYGFPLRRGRVLAGASATLVNVQLAEVSSSALALDLGFAGRLAGDRLVAAVALQHLGSAPSPGERDAPLPRTVRAGVAASQPVGIATVGGTLEAVNRRDAGTALAGGIEVDIPSGADAPAPALVLRAGFRGGGEETVRRSFSAGAAVRLRGVSVEYAYRSFELLGATHRFGVRWTRR